MSDVVNDALKVALREDLEDMSDWKTRREERTLSYEQLLTQLKNDGTI